MVNFAVACLLQKSLPNSFYLLTFLLLTIARINYTTVGTVCICAWEVQLSGPSSARSWRFNFSIFALSRPHPHELVKGGPNQEHWLSSLCPAAANFGIFPQKMRPTHGALRLYGPTNPHLLLYFSQDSTWMQQQNCALSSCCTKEQRLTAKACPVA